CRNLKPRYFSGSGSRVPVGHAVRSRQCANIVAVPPETSVGFLGFEDHGQGGPRKLAVRVSPFAKQVEMVALGHVQPIYTDTCGTTCRVVGVRLVFETVGFKASDSQNGRQSRTGQMVHRTDSRGLIRMQLQPLIRSEEPTSELQS